MCGLFKRTPPPALTKEELNLGLGKSLNELYGIRTASGFKIIESDDYKNLPVERGMINAKKTYKGGYTIQLINDIRPNYDRCDIIFMGFTEDEVVNIANAHFGGQSSNKWFIRGDQHFRLSKRGYDTFELVCSSPDGKAYC